MEKDEPFWKNAFRKIEELLKNPIKLKNEDLLIDLQDSELPVVKKNQEIKEKFKAKSSELNKKYTNYKPEIVLILQESKRLMKRKRFINRTPSPYLKSIKKSFFQDDRGFDSFQKNFKDNEGVSGNLHLPKIVKSGRLEKMSIKMRNDQVRSKIFNLK
jgi:hypothetical protein